MKYENNVLEYNQHEIRSSMALSLNEEQTSGFKLCKKPLVYLFAYSISILSLSAGREELLSMFQTSKLPHALDAFPQQRFVDRTCGESEET